MSLTHLSEHEEKLNDDDDDDDDDDDELSCDGDEPLYWAFFERSYYSSYSEMINDEQPDAVKTGVELPP